VSALEVLVAKVLGGVLLILSGVWAFSHYVGVVEQRGYDRAVRDGEIALQLEKDRALVTERKLRKQLSDEQRLAREKETRHAEELKVAQDRVRAGTDRLLCPKSRKIPGPSPGADRPAAGGPATDGGGEAIMPDVAAEILGDGAAIAGIVRKFQRLEGYFAVCRAVANGEPPPAIPGPETP
jgi:hypothetical protein